MKPLVSIIIPAYNPPEKLFRNCISSCVSQSYSNVEVIVVDDGSASFGASLIDSVCGEDRRFKVIHQENAGEGAARNAGLKHADGDFVMFVDCDDELASGWLEKAVLLASINKADIVAGKVMQVCAPPLPSIKSNTKDCTFTSRLLTREEFGQLQSDFLTGTTKLLEGLPYIDIGVCSKLIKRECLKNISFPIGIKLSSDQVFNHAMLGQADRYVVTNATAYYYLSNDSSVSHVYNPDAPSVMMKSMELIKPLLIDNENVIQSYYFRVLMEIGTAIQFSAFSDKHHLSFNDKRKIIKNAANESLVIETLDKIDMSKLPELSWKVRAFLLKHKLASLYVILKQVS